MKKAFLFLTAALLALALTGCDETERIDDNSIDVVTVAQSDALSLDGFTIMRSDSSEKVVTDAALKLKNSINEKISGADIAISTDWVKRGDPIPTGTAEIVVGNSNRLTASGLKRDDYEIIRSGNRIYILGGSDEAVSTATDLFIGSYLGDSGLLIPDNTDLIVKGSYEIESLSFGSSEVKELKFYNATSSAKSELFRKRFLTMLEEVSGLSVETVSDRSQANLIYSDSDEIADGSWGYVAENGVLTAVGHNEVENMKLCKYLTSLLSPEDKALSLNGVYSEKQITKEEFLEMKQLIIYPEFPEAIRRDYTYDVSVTQGDRTESLPVYNHVMASTVSRGYDGADDARRFSMFAFSGEQVRVDIKVKTDFTSYSVMPSAKNFKHEFKDGVISVYLDEPDYFLIRLDDSDNSIISVFADEPEFTDEYDSDAPNFVRIEGWFEPEGGIYELSEPTTLYIAPGAVLNARVDVRADGSKVIGRGAIVDPFENIYEYDIRVGGTESIGHLLFNVSANNVHVDGPVLLDARCYNSNIRGNNNVVRNFKAMSTMMTSDGIAVVWGKDTLIEHCFIYCGDNTMVHSAENTIYRDITCGTTCATLFPQGNPKNVTFDGIHVFRSDDGFVNHFYNGSNGQLTADVKMFDLDSVDCTYMPWFFQGRNMGEALKNFTIENVSLGDIEAQKMKSVFRFINGTNYMTSDNYSMTLKNFSIDDEVVASLDELSIELVGDPKHPGNEYTYSADEFKPVVHNSTKVDYAAENKVFIGNYQVMFRYPVLNDGRLLLPAEQLMEELYIDKCAATVEKNGIKYVSANDLVKSGMAASAVETDGSLVITPNVPDELFRPDSGEISNFVESTCYELDLVTSKEDGDTIYTVCNTQMTLNSGIARMITDEVRKFGTGKYKLSVRMKASESGSLSVGVFFKNAKAIVRTVNVNNEYADYSFEFEITDELLKEAKINLVIRGSGKALESFSMKDFSLLKLS